MADRGFKSILEMTGAEVEAAFRQTDLVLVPVGAVEHHGPHLPLGTDCFLAYEFSLRTLTELSAVGMSAILGPTIPFGFSPYHMDFQGTVSLRANTLAALVEDVCESLYRHGARRFAIVPGHGGNFALLTVVAQELAAARRDMRLVVLNWIKPLLERAAEVTRSRASEGHGGERETALMLAARAELVDMGAAAAYYPDDAVRRRVLGGEDPLAGGAAFLAVSSYRDVTPVGAIGNGALASRETGERLYEIVVSWMVAAIQRDLG